MPWLTDRLDIGLSDTGVPGLEIVERKGVGHPDTICDGVAEAASQALCRLYRERFGMILHHNVDKVLLWGGRSSPKFGGGRVEEPLEIFIAGRATRQFKGVDLPVEAIIEESCRLWLRRHLAFLDADRHVRVHVLLRPGSQDLSELFYRSHGTGAVLANDTSCGVGFAPLTPLETAVLSVERYLNGGEAKSSQPEIGEDIKVMAVRRAKVAQFTLSVAMIDAHVADVADYIARKGAIHDIATGVAASAFGGKVTLDINTADRPPANLYLTVTGTSAEGGDDGEAGRGNRANGLITPCRPMAMESIAGKNPINHVGKIYSIVSQSIAAEIVANIAEISSAECFLVSRIGRPITDPETVGLRIRPTKSVRVEPFRARIAEIIASRMARLSDFAEDLLAGRLLFDSSAI